MPLLEVDHLSVAFGTGPDAVSAVDDVSFSLERGQTLAVVGESGSGKSVTALSIMRLLPAHTGRVAGSIRFDDHDLLTMRGRELRHVRGNQIAMVYQDAMTALNPSMTVGAQLIETMRAHHVGTGGDRPSRAVRLLEECGIPDPAVRVGVYPHQLSGGMRQRVMIAMALACDPQILLADEITTALDVTVQAQILELIARISRDRGTAAIFITHNLAVVARIGDWVQVMYAGQIVERASVIELFARPLMPYTLGLLQSTPRLDEDRAVRLVPIPGEPPSPRRRPPGCRFTTRCAFARDKCRQEPPPLVQVSQTTEFHEARCWGLADGDGNGWLLPSPRTASVPAREPR